MKTQISVEYIKWLKEELAKINRLELKEIDFFENSMLLKHTDEELEDFRFTGLNNTDLVASNYTILVFQDEHT
jgi:hypothetical protein